MQHGTKVLVGVVGAAQGVKGEVRIRSYTGEPAAIAGYGPLLADDGRRSITILSLRPLKDDMIVAKLEGIFDRTAAAALTNLKLFVDRARLPPPAEDEVYQADLIGLWAETPDGERLGRVAGIENYGAGDLLEIAPAVGETLLVPFTRSFVPLIDIAGCRLVVERGALGRDEDEIPSAEPEGT